MYSTQQQQREYRRGRTSRRTLSRIGHERCTSLHSYVPCYHFLLLLAMLLMLYNGDDVYLLPRVKALVPRSTTTKSREGARYFTKSFLIPPLEPLDNDKNNHFRLNSNKINTGALPVIYTNDPKTVSEWINMHIPAAGKCTIGFDVEVRKK